MKILAFETSCDETSVAVLADGNVQANQIYSQTFHTEFGGVVPELSSRAHIQKIVPLLKTALREADIPLSEITHIAATAGPGLIGALMIGFTFAKGLAASAGKAFVPINHIEGHIFSGFLMPEPPEYPFICLVVSGGHTMLFLVKSPTNLQLLGTTVDDAAGEAFDKVAKILRLGYPGGPMIQKSAERGNDTRYALPIAELKGKYDFSFSGLKTAVLRQYQQLQKEDEDITKQHIDDIAASFQTTIVKSLIAKVELAIKEFVPAGISVVGGVAANTAIREACASMAQKYEIPAIIPSLNFCGDNAAMIAYRAAMLIENGECFTLDCETFPSFTSRYLS